jgi:chromosome segregation ATPase
MKLEERVEKNERRLKTVEDAIILLTKLGDSHTDQLEQIIFGIDELRAAQSETSERVNMLIDAQIRTDDEIKEIKAIQRESGERIKVLIEAQIRTEEKMQETEEKIQRMEAAITDLTGAVKFAHQKIDKIGEK